MTKEIKPVAWLFHDGGYTSIKAMAIDHPFNVPVFDSQSLVPLFEEIDELKADSELMLGIIDRNNLEICSLRAENSALREKVELHGATTKGIIQQLNDTQKQVGKIERKNIELRATIDWMGNHVAEAKKECKELEAVNDNIRMVSKASGIALDRLKAELDTEREIKTEYGRRIDAIVVDNNELRAMLREIVDNWYDYSVDMKAIIEKARGMI